MDVVNCGTISVDGKNYRIQSNSSKGFQQPAVSSPQGHVEDIEDERKGVHKGLRRGLIEDEHEDDPTITPDEQRAGGYMTSISANPELFGQVIGKQGTIKKKIEADTGATIHFPPKAQAGSAPRGQQSSQSDTEIVVKAGSRAAVAAARSRIERIIEQALKLASKGHGKSDENGDFSD